MTINLADIPAAVANYMNTKVTVVVDEVVADSGTLNPNEEGTLTVTITNADAPNGVRLTNLVHHLRIAPGSKAKLKVPGSAIITTRSGLATSSPALTRNTFVEAMFCTLETETTLDVGEVKDITFEVKGFDEGNATLTYDLHANVDQASLFPTGENSTTIDSPVAVV